MKKLGLTLALIIVVFNLPAQTLTEYDLPLPKEVACKGQGFYLNGDLGIMASFQYLNLDKNANVNAEIKFVKPLTSLNTIIQSTKNLLDNKLTHHLKLQFDIMAMSIIMTSESNSYGGFNFNWSSGRTVAEIDAEEGVYDIMIDTYDYANSGDQMYVFLHDLNLNSDVDTTINLTESAKNYMYFRGMDENGFPLLPDDTTLLTNNKQISIEFPASFVFQSATMAVGGHPKNYFRFSNINSDYLIDVGQSNVRQGEMYVLDLGHLNGISGDIVLESNPENYEKMYSVFFESPDATDDYLTFSNGIISRLRENSYYWMNTVFETVGPFYPSHDNDTIEVYLSNIFQPTNLCNLVGGVSFWECVPEYGAPAKKVDSKLFYITEEDTIQFSWFYPPAKADYNVPSNSVVNFGNSAPFANIYSVNNESSIFSYTTIFGQSNEIRTLDDYSSLYYIMQGTDILQSDTLCNFSQPYTITGSGPYSFSITDSNFYINGLKGKLEVQNNFNLPSDDPDSPMLTSFKILNSDGLICSSFNSEEQAFVHFSVLDYVDNEISDVSAVYLYYKEHNEENWVNTPVQEIPEFYDSIFLNGQYFIGDLTNAINAYSDTAFFIDLSLVVLDGANNILRERFYPAFKVVKNPVGVDNTYQSDHKLNIRVYPNPASKELSISVNNAKSDFVSLTIFNTIGHIITEKTFIGKIVMNVSNYPKGIYFVKINSGYAIETTKVIVN